MKAYEIFETNKWSYVFSATTFPFPIQPEGISMVEKYTICEPTDTAIFCNWIEIKEKELINKVNDFRSSAIWTKKNNHWVLKDDILNHQSDAGVDEYSLEKVEECRFNSSSKRTEQAEINKYTLIGRGWI